MIESREITFLLQGAVERSVVRESCSVIRNLFPQSRIVLSTWVGADVDGLDTDDTVLADDPGFFYYSDRPGEKVNNVNRQIVGTNAGLERVVTPYCVRMRTDFRLTGRDFLNFFEAFPERDEAYSVFSKRLMACSYFSRNPRSRTRFPFHPSDIIFFGLTDDIRRLFRVPLMTEEEAYWDRGDRRYNRYTPEQHIFINALRSMGRTVPCDFYNDDNPAAVLETEKYFASNFVLLTFEQFNLKPSKPTFVMKVHPNSFMTCYTHNEWLALYNRHAGGKVAIPERDIERERIECFYKPYKVCRLIGNVISFPFRSKIKRRAIRTSVLEFFLMPR